MMKRSVALGALLATTLVVGCGEDPVVPAPSASAGLAHSMTTSPTSAPAAGPVCVPFKVNGSPGAVQVTGGPPPSPLHLALSAEGEATLLGHYASSAHAVVTFPSPTTAVFDGGGTFTAANGDQLTFTYTGDFFPGPVPAGVGPYEIDGGTGRFEGATGSGVFRSEGGHTTFDGDVCLAR